MNLRFIFTFVLILFFQALFAQSTIEKADKEYELFAYQKAIDTYLKGLKTGDYDGATLSRLADCYRLLNDMDNAEKWYNKAVDMPNVPPEQILNFGKVLMAQKKYDDAKQWFSVYTTSDQFVGSKFSGNCDFAKSHINDVTSYVVTNLKQNTKSSDFGPTVANGELLVFSSTRGQSASEPGSWGQSQNTLFKGKITGNGQIGNISELHSQLTKATNEGPAAFSSSQNMVAYTKNNFVEGKRQIPGTGEELNIFISKADGNKDWNKSKSFVHNKSGYNTGYPTFSPDGKYMYFASNRPGGYGGYDIYVVKRFGKSWTKPENLGPVINSKGNEISPFFNGTDLTFSSDWHSGFGGFDIFRAEKTVDEWDKIFHLGTKINSSYDDYGFLFDNQKNQGYFVSNRPSGRGLEDIYMVKLTGTQISFVVKSESTGLPLEGVTIDLTECGGSVISTNASGKANIETTSNHDCLATFKSPDYLSETMSISTLSGKRVFEIALKNQGDIYQGLLYNAETNQPISNASIKVTNQTTGNSHTIRTDVAGNYAIALSVSTNYILKYSKARFLEVSQTVRTGDGKNRDIVKPIALAPIGVGAVASNHVPPAKTTRPNTRTTSKPTSRSASRPTTRTTKPPVATTTSTTKSTTTTKPPVASTPTTPTTTTTTAPPVATAPVKTTTTSPPTASTTTSPPVATTTPTTKASTRSRSTAGANTGKAIPPVLYEPDEIVTTEIVNESKEAYSIQLMSLGSKSMVIVDSYQEELKKFGDIYYVEENGYKKVRIGSFANNSDAKKARKAIRKKGFKSAFIVPRYVANEEATGPATSTSKISTNSTPPPSESSIGKYKVRLAAYKDVKWFDSSSVESFGTVEKSKNGDFTIMMLAGFTDLDKARAARDSAKSSGFNGAYVFELINGVMKRVQ